MKGIFNLSELNSVLKDFYTALKIRNAIFDDEYREIASYPEHLPSYCARIRSTPEGALGCSECDTAACKRAKELGQAHIYTCHAGLLEAITPIIIDGETVGYALLSHISENGNTEKTVELAHEANKKYGISKEETAELIDELKNTTLPMDKESIHAVAHILEALVSYVCTKQLVKKDYDVMADELDKYINTHISDDLRCESLCSRFHISRSYLFTISKKYFGMGISEYIKNKRLSLACEYLSSGKKPAAASELCGFSDVSYFFKVFKSELGVTPGEYIKSHTRMV